MNAIYPDKAIVLIGLKHSGKSTIARLLAPFVVKTPLDIDESVAVLAKERLIAAGESVAPSTPSPTIIRQFYGLMGRDAFQNLEWDVTESLIEAGEFQRYLIATGGGIVENERTMPLLKEHGVILFINAPEAVLFARIMRGGLPPFLDKDDPEASFHALYEKRTALARQYADIEVGVQQQPIEHVLALVLKSIKEQFYGR